MKDVRKEGGGGWPKSRHNKGGCVDLVLYFIPKCGQGGRGSKILKILQKSFTVRKDRITFFNAQEIEQRAHVEASVFAATR